MKKIVGLFVLLSLSAFTLFGCSNQGAYKDGSYEGFGKGNFGNIKVSVEVKGSKISSIKLLEHNETKELINAVAENMIPGIIKKQTTEGVDIIAGATNSSNGVVAAVNEALKNAKK